MANPSLQIGNGKWAIKEDNLLGYSKAGTRFVPEPITMTRESAGTRVNPEGLVETVELLGSELVTNGSFDGGTTGWILQTPNWAYGSNDITSSGSGGNQLAFQTNIFEVGKNYNINFEITSYTSGILRLRNNSVLLPTNYNLAGEYTLNLTASEAGFLGFQNYSSFIGTITNISVKESTKNNLARVDYDGTSSSLLVEPERTNLITYSEDFSQSYWTKTGTSVISGFTSPDGTANAYKMTEDSATSVHKISNNSAISNSFQSQSIFIKYDSSQQFIQTTSSRSISNYVNFDILNKTLTNYGTSVGKIVELSSGWLRLEVYHDSSTTAYWHFITSLTASWSESYLGTGKHLLIFGAQVEEGSYATSYIPTDGSTVTRVQDQYSKTGISNLINSEEGTFFVEMAALSELTDSRVISINNGTSNYYIWLNYKNTSNTIRYVYGFLGTNYADLQTVVADATLNTKIAMTWKLNEFKFFINGFKISEDLSGAVMPSGTLNKLEFNRPNGAEKMNGKVKKLQVYKTSLSDTQLAALTTI